MCALPISWHGTGRIECVFSRRGSAIWCCVAVLVLAYAYYLSCVHPAGATTASYGTQSDGKCDDCLPDDTRTWRMARLGLALVGYENRSEEHTSELQSLMRISYAAFFLKKKQQKSNIET